MNDLGWTLGWHAVRVALVLVPAIGLHALATRRGPAAGAWAATLGLGMVVVLGILACWPGLGGEAERSSNPASASSIEKPIGSSRVEPRGEVGAVDRTRPSADRGPAFDGFRLAWGRFERRAAGPVARFRPWGKALAILGLAGSGVGLIRLLVGLWAVGLCRSRGRVVEDAGMVGLVKELRRSMGCGPAVELREVPDLTTPATAGWFRPMLLLPGDWRGWDESERRAVVAHELAHVVRGDYAAGLLARGAVVLNYYHPLVRWLAGRLHLEQELAADAMGSMFAGGRSSYLRALSRLALQQEGRPSSWPARAFLPSRGTLIRRIAMLKDENRSRMTGTDESKARRLATALGLLALTVGVASWKAPASAAGDEPSVAPVAKAVEVAGGVEPFEVRFIPETMKGVVAFRPAATARRAGMGGMTAWLRGMYADGFAELAKQLQIDTNRPGFRKLACEDIESVAIGMNIDMIQGIQGKPAKAEPKPTHRLMFSGFTARAVAPFDWPAFLRQWKLDLKEVREGRGVYYQLNLPVDEMGPWNFGILLPDDRTIVVDDVKWIKELAGREAQAAPTFLRGADWDRASRGILAFAVDNHDDRFAKEYDLGRPDDAIVLSVFRGVERWTLGVADRDDISLRAEATARDPKAAEAVSRSIEALAKLGLKALDAQMGPEEDLLETGVQLQAFQMYRAFLAGLKPKQVGASLTLRPEGLGSIADAWAIIKAEFAGKQVAAKVRAEEAKAAPKVEKH